MKLGIQTRRVGQRQRLVIVSRATGEALEGVQALGAEQTDADPGYVTVTMSVRVKVLAGQREAKKPAAQTLDEDDDVPIEPDDDADE